MTKTLNDSDDVTPNTQNIQLKNVNEKGFPENCGVIGIKFNSATNLPIADVATSDPYIKLYGKTNGSIYYFGQSKTVYKSLDPKWNEIIFFPTVCASTILIKINDYNFGLNHTLLAKCEITVSNLFKKLKPGFIKDEDKNIEIECFTKDPQNYDLISLEKREDNNMKITLQPFVPTEGIYDLKAMDIPCSLCIAYINSKTKNPLLQIRELDMHNKILVTNKYSFENGMIKTPFKFSKSYCIKLEPKAGQQYQYSKFQFYQESLQKAKSSLSNDCYIVFVGMPNVNKTVLTSDSLSALDLSNKKNWPFYINKKFTDMNSKNVYLNDHGRIILSKQQIGDESIITQIEKEIDNASVDQIHRIYKEFNQLVETILAHPSQNDYLMHRDDVAKLCQKLIEKIRSFPTLPYEREIMRLIRTKYIFMEEINETA